MSGQVLDTSIVGILLYILLFSCYIFKKSKFITTDNAWSHEVTTIYENKTIFH